MPLVIVVVAGVLRTLPGLNAVVQRRAEGLSSGIHAGSVNCVTGVASLRMGQYPNQ
jgi:hypothetical protein